LDKEALFTPIRIAIIIIEQNTRRIVRLRIVAILLHQEYYKNNMYKKNYIGSTSIVWLRSGPTEIIRTGML
jgi:hypothetical protein